jgi:thaumarchaeosortase
LFFSLFFLAFDVLAFNKTAKIQWTTRRKIASGLMVCAGAAYFVEVGLGQTLTAFIYSVGSSLGASGQVSNSFLMSTDYMAFIVYMVVLTIALFNTRTVPKVSTVLIFSAGMVTFYLLDAFFPYGSIGPLQFWANFIVADVAALAWLFRLPIYGLSNHLTIFGKHGIFPLVVYWPSVGVQSILIYSLVMLVLAAKLDAPVLRKVIYSVVGIAGTVMLNVTRIFAISLYGYLYASSLGQLDAFHNVIGEVLFPIWIVAYLVIIIHVEDRLAGRAKQPMENQRNVDTTTKLNPNPKGDGEGSLAKG